VGDKGVWGSIVKLESANNFRTFCSFKLLFVSKSVFSFAQKHAAIRMVDRSDNESNDNDIMAIII